MKLIKCEECGDMVALRSWLKKCKCGKSLGYYLEDNRTVEVSGPCIILGVPNGIPFQIPDHSPFIRRITLKEKKGD